MTSNLPPKPIPPLPSDCCDSGCTTCVWTVYDEELARWHETVAALRAAAAITPAGGGDAPPIRVPSPSPHE